MDTSAKDCLALFDTSVEGRMENGWASGVLHQRTKTVKAGPMVYMDCYPVWDTKGASQARREAKKEAHAKAQARLDARRRARRVEQLVNANFGAGDMLLTCEYAQGHQPEDGAQAKRDIVNFLRRVNGLCAKRGLAMRRYIYITEWTKSEKYGIRWHHHVILSGEGLTREDVEGKWTDRHGGYCNTRRAQPNEKHLSGFAQYMMQNKAFREGKNPQGKAGGRSWGHSMGLIQPTQSVADKKVSIRKAGRIAETIEDMTRAKEIFDRLYPQCELLEVTAKRSEWAAGVYIRALLRKTEKRRDRHGAGRSD